MLSIPTQVSKTSGAFCFPYYGRIFHNKRRQFLPLKHRSTSLKLRLYNRIKESLKSLVEAPFVE